MAVSRTDVFQAMVMLVCLTILPMTLIFATAEPFTATGQSPGFSTSDRRGGRPDHVGIRSLDRRLGTGRPRVQRILQRFMAIESEDRITTSRNIGITWIVLIFSFAFLVGLVARPALTEMGLMGELTGDEGLFDPERVYFVASEAFFLPIFTGLLLTGVVAAIMSTADSQLLLGSAIATDDLPLTKRVARRFEHAYVLAASGRVWLGRLLLLVIGGAAGASAIVAPDSVASLVAYAWGGMGAAFGPVAILALYWRRFSLWGALASIIVGAVTVSVWQLSSDGPWGMFDMEIATAPGFIAATIAAIVVTLLTSPPSAEVTERFGRVTAAA